MKNTKRYYSRHILFFFLLIMGGIALYFLDQETQQRATEEREFRQAVALENAVVKFKSAVDKFAALISGVRSYMRHAPEFPGAVALQNFINTQLEAINYKDSIIVSYIDADQVFRYSFTPTQMNPVGLVGTSVRDIRSKEIIDELDAMMMDGNLHLYAPLNLVEGWVGIPLDFGVHRDGKVLGYIAPLINFKTIIDNVYTEGAGEEYAFRFRTSEGFDFDRNAVYDGTRIYGNGVDKEYYKNFDLDTASFMYKKIHLYNLDFEVGVAYKQRYRRNPYFAVLLFGWYATLVIFSISTIRQSYFYRQLSALYAGSNKLLKEKNEEITLQSEMLSQANKELESRNIKLIELDEEKNNLIEVVAHDLRSPLAQVVNLLDLAEFSIEEKEELSRYIAESKASTTRLTDMVTRILDINALENESLVVNFQKISLSTSLEKVAESYSKMAEKKDISIHFTPDDEGCFVRGDADYLYQVFENLVSNAIKFSPRDSNIFMEIEKYDDKINAVIRDEGPGISEEDQSKLFKKYQKLSAKPTGGEGSTGLGLSIVKKFIEAMEGKIKCESKLGEGTAFIVKLRPWR